MALEFLAFLGLLVAMVGFVLYGVATLQARVLPRWCGVGFIVGLPVWRGIAMVSEYGGLLGGTIGWTLGGYCSGSFGWHWATYSGLKVAGQLSAPRVCAEFPRIHFLGSS